MFITFEGVEGSGKSTQIDLLANRLKTMGHDVLTTREPGGTRAGAAIRKILLDPQTGALDPMTELLLFCAARRELVAAVIEPAIEGGRIVLCDRFADSTAAYQGHARGLGIEPVTALSKQVCGGVWPDRTIILDLPVEEGLKRAGHRMETEGRGESRFEDEDLDFHRLVRDGYLQIAKIEPDRVTVIDTTVPKESVHEAIFNAVRDILAEA